MGCGIEGHGIIGPRGCDPNNGGGSQQWKEWPWRGVAPDRCGVASDTNSWIESLSQIYIKETQRFYSGMNIHVLYQNPQSKLFKVWMVFRFVDSDFWLLNHIVNNKSDTKVLFLIEYSCVLSKSTRWTLQWMIFRFVDSDLWHMNLYHKHKRDTEISVLNE